MCRLHLVEPHEASELTREIFKEMVFVPHVFYMMANSEAVISSFTNHFSNHENYILSAKHRKMLSLAVSQFNDCLYCVAHHTTSATEAGLLTSQECMDARKMKSPDPRTNTVLSFAKTILENRGHVKNEIIDQMKHHDFSDQAIIEVIATISIITQVNYIANVGKPELDYPDPPPLED